MQLSEQQLLLINVHHVAFDGGSTGVLLGEPDPEVVIKCEWPRGKYVMADVDCGEEGSKNVKRYATVKVGAFHVKENDFVLLTPEETDEMCEIAQRERGLTTP